jgi:hypothetical protein
MGEFVPFRDPSQGGEQQLAYADGLVYRCGGCREVVPDGVWLFETLEEYMVVGITARMGGADAEVVHRCGKTGSGGG